MDTLAELWAADIKKWARVSSGETRHTAVLLKGGTSGFEWEQLSRKAIRELNILFEEFYHLAGVCDLT